MLLEMVVFHTVWIYRENTDRDRPVLYAIGVEIVNLVIGIGGFVILLAVGIGLQEYTGIPAFYTLIAAAVTGFVYLFGKAAYVVSQTGESN